MAGRILVVDDQDIRILIQKFLERVGYGVDVADSFERAVELIQTNEYSILVTDKNMPHPDGSEESGMLLLEYVSKHYPQIEILMMTGYASVGTAVSSIQMGAFDYLEKPFSMAELQAKIERIQEYQAYVDPEDTVGIHKDLQDAVLDLVSDREKLSLNEFNCSMDSLTEKLGDFSKAQSRLLKNSLRQRRALDDIASLSRQILDNASDALLVKELAERIEEQAR